MQREEREAKGPEGKRSMSRFASRIEKAPALPSDRDAVQKVRRLPIESKYCKHEVQTFSADNLRVIILESAAIRY